MMVGLLDQGKTPFLEGLYTKFPSDNPGIFT